MAISSNDKTICCLLEMLKLYRVRYIVASPGMQNSKFNSLAQEDKNFKCYSVVDERSAAYFALGLSYETSSPVVITCTGATASRNYMSALTEAFYRKIPIIAITFFNSNQNNYSLSPQFVDRTSFPKDIVYTSINLYKTSDSGDLKNNISMINSALFNAVYKSCPVHINCPSSFNFKDLEKYLSMEGVWVPEYYLPNDITPTLRDVILNFKTAIFIGSHQKFSLESLNIIEKFALAYDVPVICDHTSNYYRSNKLLISQVVFYAAKNNFPELIIDIGDISGEYSLSSLFEKAKIWRISEIGFSCRQNTPIEKFFYCSEQLFFNRLLINKQVERGLYSELRRDLDQNINNDIELPLCNAHICRSLAKFLPSNSILHLSILNSLRSMNFFELDPSIEVNCNVGGFGIDGPLSTLIGQSVGNNDKYYFGVIGDLAFFYDMNILGNRHVGKNLRIIVVNNNRGEEFRLNPILEQSLGEKTDTLISASGHFKNGAKNWALSSDFIYFRAENIKEFDAKIKSFCTDRFDKPVLFEILTSDVDEKQGLKIIKSKKVQQAKTEKKAFINLKNLFK